MTRRSARPTSYFYAADILHNQVQPAQKTPRVLDSSDDFPRRQKRSRSGVHRASDATVAEMAALLRF